MRPLVLGTAGHIDHGKTWLVRALTGKDTDRLPEEKERAISIDLGYAPLRLPSGQHISVIDVPGHERFVRNMVAGATGIDLFLLVIDANEGARPQTHEHLAILRLLGIEHGVVAVTKVDAVDEELLALALDEARELMPGASVIATSAKTGAGLDDLQAALARVASRVERRALLRATRLFVDRSFTIAGIGTVITGTLWSGSIGEGDELIAEPLGLPVRVRSVQVHDEAVERAEAGQRVAVALPGVERDRIRRGAALVARDVFPVSYRLDITMEALEPLESGRRVHVHHGSAKHFGRLVLVSDDHAQLRLTTPAVAARGDRVVLRDGTTIAGGTVLDPAPPRRLELDRLAMLEQGDPASIVHGALAASPEPLTKAELARRGLLSEQDLESGLQAAVEVCGYFLTEAQLDEIRATTARALRQRAIDHPLDPGIPLAELLPPRPWSSALLELLPMERRGPKAYAPGETPQLGDRVASAKTLLTQLAQAGLNPIKPADRELAVYLENNGDLVHLGDGYAISTEAFERAKAHLVEECTRAGEVTLARFRDLIGTGRRTAQLLLERFDSDGLTRRVGDTRVLRRRAQHQ
ncbi:MAG: selenocysteine-specific translation elongation factor [Actinomycetia bacterium]|nr:selenocysteine-specific translation elongation factor [Actinomycetes bacterium]